MTTEKTPGQIAYEADLAAEPLYHTGRPRRTWQELDQLSRDSWERNPTPRNAAPKTRMVCASCGGENVMRDAWAVWSVDDQNWTLGNVFDAGYCDDCGGETSIEERPADPARDLALAGIDAAAAAALARKTTED